MSERYIRLFSLPERLYAKGSPVMIAAGALLKDNYTGRVLAQLKLRNISNNTIKAVTVRINPMDTVGNPLGDPVNYQYLDLSAARDDDFCQKVPVFFPNDSTRSYSVEVTEVIFTDNSVWSAAKSEWTQLPLPNNLYISDAELMKQYRIEYGQDCAYKTEQTGGDLWYCACGTLNRQSESFCRKCGKSFVVMSNIDMKVLADKRDARIEQEKLEREEAERIAAEEARLAEEKKAKAKKKAVKIAVIVTPIAIVCIVFMIVLFTVIIPGNKYNKALELYEAGSYNDAAPLFEEIKGYKDSDSLLKECKLYTSIDYKVLEDDSIRIVGLNSTMADVDIPAELYGHTVTEIDKSAFSNMNTLVSVTIPDTVTSIGDMAFQNCKNLTSVTLGKCVRSIGNYAFGTCSGLTEIKIPGSVTSIGRYAFVDCSSLKDITIPDSVKDFGFSIFLGAKNVTIHGREGSEVQKYAKKNKLKFVAE